MRARGRRWLSLAAALDTPQAQVLPAPRPAPRPPAEARPRQLSVTAIKTLIRDPYAIYASRILRLRPLDPLKPGPDPRLRGEALHRIVEAFVKEFVPQESPAVAQARLLKLAESVLQQMIPWPSAQRLWLARLTRIAPELVAQEGVRRAEGDPAVVELRGSIPLAGLGFTLTAQPDRIDLLHDGTAVVFDYKSGTVPSDAEVMHFDKQLLLEAAMIARGAYSDIGPRVVSGMSYIHLGGSGETRRLGFGPQEVDETWEKVQGLVARYLSPAQGFAARRAMQLSRDKTDYDHLSRFGEWDITDLPTPEDVK
jgi:ATP-dependent helicase/nuclease subunit B